MLSLRQVRYFIAVADTEKVSAAATQLGISQSAVTLAIKDLEETLGVTLFTRRSGGVSLTQEGQNFRAHADNIESAVADAVGSMRRNLPDLSGKIRLGVTYTASGYVLFPLLSRFRRTNPWIDFELVEAPRSELENMLERKEIDIAFMLVSNLSAPDRFHSKVLKKSSRRLWLSNIHPLTKKSAVTMAEIASQPYVFFRADESNRASRRFWHDAGHEPNVVFETGSLEAVRSMVATGNAVTILSDLVYRPWSLDGGRVERRNIVEGVPSMDVGIAWRHGYRFSAAESRFRDFLIAATDS
ncbi:LysR family transcriptional regulator [Pelagibius sp. Alg239-R121]|uniref:LysR family transcriptional regulator n=1 Tax=Pelagibius sp. Alg239-R121 TaxID=2993448 RepID=UPI0024A730AD|nr:LysR family transcriptional regulator [Pelagibius sp. Alg239-R121]